ncbi:MAG: radical SAM protein [Desulfobulbaceae bacterium]|jgi:pyruvate-formate lyase-activating enzyme|nr:radical SAM protein [Desulfobulbaceae bacterium]
MPSKPVHPHKIPNMVYANSQGEILDLPDVEMAGRAGRWFFRPELTDIIPLPAGSDVFVLPNRMPIGIEPVSGDPVLVNENPEGAHLGIQAVAGFMSPAHTAIYTAAFEKDQSDPSHLPLFAYTAIGWLDDQFWVCGFRSDQDQRQEFDKFSDKDIAEATNKQLSAYKNNRLIQHLGKCCLTYGCPAAKNLFLGRFEAPLPTSPGCNANCVGCISLQPSGCCPSTQDRLQFVPTPQEIAEVALNHFAKAPHGIVSFGQGCEGEPLLQADIIEQAIRIIRKQTSQGTINLNSNSSLPEAVERLAHAGLDSIRVSINSARKGCHTLYYNPEGFSFKNVLESILAMKKAGKHVSINYFMLPGFTDDPDEYDAFCDMVDLYRPDLIQLRNLNMDPDWYFDVVQHPAKEKPMGIQNWLNEVKKRFPELRYGYFNPPLF